MKFVALTIVGVAAYEKEWAEFQAAQGQRNGDIPEAFKHNVDLVNAHNAESSEYKLSFTGPFAAADSEEYKQVLGYKPRSLYGDLPKVAAAAPVSGDLAESMDWTEKGAVTAVKNQGQCGSCWAFSTTGGLEGTWEVATGKLVSLSEQQLVDCSKDNMGCGGGLMDKGFAFLEGVDTCTEDSYPYTARDGTCDTKACSTAIPKGSVTGFVDVTGGEDGLMTALQQQPVSVAIEADQSAFQLYQSGVLTGNCGQQLDHGVLAVGYGTESGTDYWKVKNSWGTSWGETGYLRIERGSNKCGIASQPSYPTVQSSVVV